ncbi:MAG: phosphoenolpyruvate--protein phosphotransferase [Planctomycetota bacterium]|nr:phosphoenolpyruvate--protein phosphotransferase [Planctomycetota bacterium]
MTRQRNINGISVAPGLTMGPVHVVRAAPDVIPSWSIPEDQVLTEVRRVHDAVEGVCEELERRRQVVAEQANESDANILAVHAMIVRDPSAITEIEKRIREDRLNAEACVQALIERLESSLSSLDGESIRGYAADASDPWRAVLEELMQTEKRDFVAGDERVILAASQLTPQVATMLDRDRVLAVICETGGRFSHGAVLARSFGFPCVVGLPNLLGRLEQGMRVIVRGDQGTVQLLPTEDDIDAFLVERSRLQARAEALSTQAELPAETPNGHVLEVMANIESIHDFGTFNVEHTDGVGLLRTEFLYMERAQFPSEEEQYRLYRRVFKNMGGRPVTLRTLDIGGDKQLPYFNMPKEANPALGWRGIRVTLRWKDLLRVQLRAALRASAHGDLRLMFPMITTLDEILEIKETIKDLRVQLLEQGYEIAEDVSIGIMIEVPAAVFSLKQMIEEVDFVSVGTNDLVQYLLAADRDNPFVGDLYDPHQPAVIEALSQVAKVAKAAGKSCSVCGEMAGDHMNALLLMGMGYDALSVAPNFISEVKYAVRRTTTQAAEEIFREVALERSGAGVRQALQEAAARLMEVTTAELIQERPPLGSSSGDQKRQEKEGGAL